MLVYTKNNTVPRGTKKFFEVKVMKNNTKKVMQGVGVAMAVGSVVAAASASMAGNRKTDMKKTAKKAMNAVNSFAQDVQSIMK